MEKRRKDLLLRLAKLRSGDTALSNLPPPPSPPPSPFPPPPPLSPSPSLSSSSLSSEVLQKRSRAPCKERRTLPTQPATCSWAADSFPPKYCMAEELTQLPVDTPGSPWKLGHRGGGKKFAFVLRRKVPLVSHGAAFHILGAGRECGESFRQSFRHCSRTLLPRIQSLNLSFEWDLFFFSSPPTVLKADKLPGTVHYLLSVVK